jgi:hypothetical protein
MQNVECGMWNEYPGTRRKAFVDNKKELKGVKRSEGGR